MLAPLSSDLREAIAASSARDAVIHWNRIQHLKGPYVPEATLALWHKMAAAVEEQESRTWFEVFLQVLENLPEHRRNPAALAALDPDFLQRVEKWPEVWSKSVLLRAEALVELGPREEVEDLLEPLAGRPWLFTEIAVYLRAYYCLLVARQRVLDLKQARLLYRLVRAVGPMSHITVASGRETTILRYLATVYRVNWLQRQFHLAGDATTGWVRYLFHGLEEDLFLHGRRIPYAKWYRAKRRERERIQRLLSDEPAGRAGAAARPILVTRAQGGLGDIVMMNYALQQLRRSQPGREIVFAVSKSYLPWCAFFDGITPRDIRDPALALSDYGTWYNLSECPAAHEESGPGRDRVSRIEAWCRALDVSYHAALAAPPRLRVNAVEEGGPPRHDSDRRQVVALQWASADRYKDYPAMGRLARRLAERHHVLVFHSQPLPAADEALLDSPHVDVIVGAAPDRVVALLQTADLICSPDSSFFHLAGQLDKPALVLAGPINGKLNTKAYPKIDYLDRRAELNCIPCWRNEAIHCLATGDFNSLCLQSLEVDTVAAAISRKLADPSSPPART